MIRMPGLAPWGMCICGHFGDLTGHGGLGCLLQQQKENENERQEEAHARQGREEGRAMLKLGEVGSAIQQMVNAASKVLKAAGKAGITPTERKSRTVKKAKSKPAAKPADNEGDDE